MKHKLVLFWIASIFTVLGSYAQNNSTFLLKGEVKDSISGNGVPYATLRIMTPGKGKGKAVAVGTTDTNGKFNLKVARPGAYRLQVVNLGMAPLERDIELKGTRQLDLGTLLMQEYSSTLGTATVTAQRPIVKAEIDKLSYSISEDPDAETNSLLDMLRKVPMVTVDGEDNIQVNGSGSFKVYVNGKLNTMMSANPSLILKNYPASAVKKVEVVTDPGAKYDAEGVAGVLNIVTEADTKTTGYTLTPHINPSNRGVFGSLFGMAQIGKLTVSGNYGIGHMTSPTQDSRSERETFADETFHLLRSTGANDYSGTFQFGSLDASYEFDTHNLLSVTAGLHQHKGEQTGFTRYDMLSADNSPVYGYGQWSRSKSTYRGINASADYQHTFDKEGRSVTFSYRFNTSPSHDRSTRIYNNTDLVPYGMEDMYSDPQNHSYEHTGQVDFTTPIGKLHTLSTGAKYIYRINRSDNTEFTRPSGSDDAFEISEDASLRYRHRNDIVAGYAEYTLKLKKFTARTGLRYEHSRVKVNYPDGSRESFGSNFDDLVPSVSFGYNLSEGSMLKAGYNMRIGRPDISYLSPYVSRPTPETQSYGNPGLESEKAHNFNLSFSKFTPKLNVNASLSYMLQTNGLTSYSFLDENGIQTTTFDNFLHTKDLGLNLYLNWTIFNGTVLNINANGNYTDYKALHLGDEGGTRNHGFSGGCWGGIRQDLPWKLKLNLHGGGSTKNINLQGEGNSFYFYALNLSRSFLKEDRLTLSVMAGNFIHPKRKFTNTTVTDDFRFESMTRVDMLRFGMGIRYRLGSLKAIVKKASRTIDNSDVKQQSSGGSGQSGMEGGM